MSTSITKKSADHSDRNCFSFSFFCDRCERSWKSKELPFTHGGFAKIDLSEVRDMIWMGEHRIAFERANLEAQFHFNHCPVCGKWVCDDCFNPLGSNGCNICRDCETNRKTE